MQTTETRTEFNLGWAMAAALALHAIALLVSLVVPVFEFVSAAPPPAPDTITFTLADPERTRPDVEPSAPPAPSVPAPVATPSIPQPRLQAPQPRPVEVPPIERRAEPDPPATTAETTPRSEPAPLTDRGAPAPDPGEPAEQPNRSGSLMGALREFRSAVRSAPPPPADSAPSRPTNVFSPDMSQVPLNGSQLGELTFESRDYDWSDYGRQIYMAIWRAWHRRLHASTDEFERWAHRTGEWYIDRQSGVRFTIERSGRVVGIEVEFPGGCAPLDRSAADALAEVVLPPLPEDFPRDREVVHGRFVIRGEVRAMRPGLGRMKAAGLF